MDFGTNLSTTLTDLAPELLHQIFNHLHSIPDVLALSSTCHSLHSILPSSSRLPALFRAAERDFGPLEDITQILTYNSSQPAHAKRVPRQSYALLKQMLPVGRIGKKLAQDLYPARRWGEDKFLERRALTDTEAWKLRRATYRYWLYCAAFQGRGNSRSCRLVPSVVEERAQLLRCWSTEELLEIEDLRTILEDIMSNEICPTDGAVFRSMTEDCDFLNARHKRDLCHQSYQPFYQQRSWNSWPPDPYTAPFNMAPAATTNLFHSLQDDVVFSRTSWFREDLPIPQRRKQFMQGWGDDISQYYVIQSMMKLDPAQIIGMYETVVTKLDVEQYVLTQCDGGEWFWDNGQTWLDTWSLVLYKRGEDLGEIRADVVAGISGIVGGASGGRLGNTL